MYDPDVFAVITAHDTLNLADGALRLEHNSRWFSKAAGGVALEPSMNSRETTPADDTPSGDVEKKEVLARNIHFCIFFGLEREDTNMTLVRRILCADQCYVGTNGSFWR
ncbi:hypothetical protein LTS02_017241 [Friedmanniomyces endolithicus]|nr:hypothetical protein LTS02_017241 [Friedmanniomyces endolithicus]